MQAAVEREWDRVWVGVSIATMVAGADAYGKSGADALAVKDGRIAWLGPAAEARHRAAAHHIPVEECAGLWMTPGLIDCHTHLVYGGNRVDEFEKRLCGVPYEEIARAGGGIQSTVRATRAADAAELMAAATIRATRLMSEGVTTLEVKSGYGLDFDTERRMLEVARALSRELPVSIRTTFLGLHALPPDYRDRRAAFVAQVSGPWLDRLMSLGLIDAVDAFCENIAFTLAETEIFLRAARDKGLRAHVHAGQLSDMGAAELAARYGALSVDHVEYLSERGGGNGGRVAARRLLHAAPDHPAAGARVACGRSAVGSVDRCESRHLTVHIDPPDAEHGVHIVRADARRSARGRDPQRRAGARPAG